MKYNVQHGRVIDENGQVNRKGDIVELGKEKAEFYAHRIEAVDGLPDEFPLKEKLVEAGYDSQSKVHEATDEDLLAINGVGESRLLEIRNYGINNQ